MAASSLSNQHVPFPPLPRSRTPLIGREAMVSQVSTLVTREGVALVTLTGPGGVGKTRLALAVAEHVAAAFADGVAVVALASIRDPDLVPGAIAQAIDVRDDGYELIVDGIVSAIGQRHMLLVLDNFEQVLDAAPVVSALLDGCAHLAILVASRTPLRLSGEHSIAVAPLALPDAEQLPAHDQLARVASIQLFVERAHAARSEFALTESNAAAVVSICTRVDGLPLAIELAAARIRLLSPSVLLANLEQRLHVLVGGPRDQPTRQQALRDTIAWSYELLSPAAQRLFGQLAVFVGGWTVEAAEVVAAEERDVLAGVGVLLDHSLVQLREQPDGSTRFGMLETLREYALEQLEASGERDAVRARHAAFYGSLVEHGHPELGEIEASGERHFHQFAAHAGMDEHVVGLWRARLEPEHDNLRAALTALLETHENESALRLACALGTFWTMTGQLSEGGGWLERALRHGVRAPIHLHASAHSYAGDCAMHLGDYQQALAHYEASRALWEELNDEHGILEELVGLAGVAEYQGDDARAIELYDEIATRARGTSEQLVSVALANLSYAAYQQMDLERALALAEEALATCPTQPFTRTLVLCSVAQVEIERGNVEQAMHLYAESLALSQTVKHAIRIADALAGLAAVAVAAGQVVLAARLLGAVSTVSERHSWSSLMFPMQHERALAATRAVLAPVAFERGFTEGRSLTLNDAIAETYAILAAVSAPSTPQPSERAAPHGLSPRELDVLRLLVEGQSDREIADALFISYRTVTSHVGSILNKLGVDSRTAAATYAVRHHLLDHP